MTESIKLGRKNSTKLSFLSPHRASEKSFDDYHQKSNIFDGNSHRKKIFPLPSSTTPQRIGDESFTKEDFRDDVVVKLTCNWNLVASEQCRFSVLAIFQSEKLPFATEENNRRATKKH